MYGWRRGVDAEARVSEECVCQSSDLGYVNAKRMPLIDSRHRLSAELQRFILTKSTMVRC